MIIALHGQINSGKDTVISRIRQLFPNFQFEKIGFSDKPKQLFASTLGISLDQVEYLKDQGSRGVINVSHYTANGMMVGRHQVTVRRALQQFTTAFRQQVAEDFWDGLALPIRPAVSVSAEYPPTRNILINDLRLPSEATRVKSLGGEIWRVLAPFAEPDHETEIPLPPELVDVEIDNRVRNDGFASLDSQLALLMSERLPRDSE